MPSDPPECGEADELAARFLRVMEHAFKKLSSQRTTPAQPHIFHQLNGNQIRGLHLLQQTPGMSQKDLANELGITPVAVSITVRQMEKLGLIERRPDPDDARQVQLHLTQSAKDSLIESHKFRARAVSAMLAPLPVEDQLTIVQLLERSMITEEGQATGPPDHS